MFDKLEAVQLRHQELTSMLSDPGLTQDPKELQRIAREHGQLQEVVDHFSRYKAAKDELTQSKQLLTESQDDELRELAREEVSSLEQEIEALTQRLQLLLLPKDPLDGKDIFLEIRAGTGGEEAALFAADMFRMYSRYASLRGWRVQIVSESESERGGYREIIAKIEGDDVYSRLKYEAGTHRVQRVPETESQGRIHTSAITVAILPEVDDVEVHINEGDLRIDTYRSSGAGGQHVNTTDSAIRITHKPSGIVVQCQSERSQHQNKATAMTMLRAALFEQQQRQQQQSVAAERREQVGSGDRSERIRTYNYPQSRITDHRIGLTSYRLQHILEGEVDEIIQPLITHHQAEALQRLSQR